MNTARILNGNLRREFMASVVGILGAGGQRFAEEHLEWNRGIIRKGQSELRTGIVEDRLHNRGRKLIEERLPDLLVDIREIVEPSSQTDPTFRTTKIYTPLSAGEVRKRLVDTGKYKDKELPTIRTIRTKLNRLGFTLKRPAKCKPQKRIEETDEIFEEVKAINTDADSDPRMIRISLDTKAVVSVGDYARGGKSRQGEKALDHDMGAKDKITPFGIMLPATKETFIWHSTSKVTADFMADRVDELIPELKARTPDLQTLVINADNGPESSGRRTQWLKRMVEISDKHKINIQLAYYPPYHSKYNPIERVWGVLENHWGGELLNSVEKISGLTRSMHYAGIRPVVKLIRKIYKTGKKLTKLEMEPIEERLERTEGLENWFIWIQPNLG